MGAGRSLSPISQRSTAAAAERPSAIAQTMRLWPREAQCKQHQFTGQLELAPGDRFELRSPVVEGRLDALPAQRPHGPRAVVDELGGGHRVETLSSFFVGAG